MHYHIYCKRNDLGINYREAISEFTKRLSIYCNITLYLDSLLQFPQNISPHNHQFFQIISGPSSYSSEEFACGIERLLQSGKSHIHIIIGFTEEECLNALSVLQKDALWMRFSLTRSSLPADTLTLLFFEQLYRGYTILHGKTYHK